MSYQTSYSSKTARIIYTGETTEQEINDAHSQLSGDDRFYSCKNLILDVTHCNLEKVSVPELVIAMATDIGASSTIGSLKVAFIVKSFANMEKTSEYINMNIRTKIPWQWRLFESEEHAEQWLD